MVVSMPRSGGGMVVSGKVRACCEVAVGRGAFGRAGAPCRIVVYTGDAIVGSFT